MPGDDELAISALSIPNDCGCAKSVSIYKIGSQTCNNLYRLAQAQESDDDKDDLLRSMLIFACSTIDSLGKQLVRDCLKELIDQKESSGDSGAKMQFQSFIRKQIDKEGAVLLARVLSAEDYREELVDVLKQKLTDSSLQSYQQLAILTGHFGVPTDKVINKKDADAIFDARNKITHEMDIDQLAPGSPQPTRRRRAEGELKALTEKMLGASKLLVEQVHKRAHP